MDWKYLEQRTPREAASPDPHSEAKLLFALEASACMPPREQCNRATSSDEGCGTEMLG